MAAVNQNGFALEFASEDIHIDREIVMTAVKKDGLALKFTSEDLKKDREIVMAAVKQNGDALKFASEDLKRDREIVMAAVKQDGGALVFASEDLQKGPPRTPHRGSAAALAPTRHRGGPPLARPIEEHARGAKFVRSVRPRHAAFGPAELLPPRETRGDPRRVRMRSSSHQRIFRETGR